MPLALEVLTDILGAANLDCQQKGIQFSLRVIPVWRSHCFWDICPCYPKDTFEFQHLTQTLFRPCCTITVLLVSVIPQLHSLVVRRTHRKYHTFRHKAQSRISYPVPQMPARNHFHGNWSACVPSHCCQTASHFCWCLSNVCLPLGKGCGIPP